MAAKNDQVKHRAKNGTPCVRDFFKNVRCLSESDLETPEFQQALKTMVTDKTIPPRLRQWAREQLTKGD